MKKFTHLLPVILLTTLLFTACGPATDVTTTKPTPGLEIQVERYLETLPEVPDVEDIRDSNLDSPPCGFFYQYDIVYLNNEGEKNTLKLGEDGSLEVDGQNFSASDPWLISCGGQNFVLKRTRVQALGVEAKGLSYWSLWIISE